MNDESGRYGLPLSKARIAVLVDGENLPPDHAGAVLRAAQRLGSALICRVYGNVQRMPKWDAQPGFRPIHSGSGKNATDLLLCLDAMELALTAKADGFVIASSDRDFTHLAHRLREAGFPVTGLGEEKTPAHFRAACTAWVTVGAPPPAPAPKAPSPQSPPPPPSAAATTVAPMDRLIHDMIRSHSAGSSGMPIEQLAPKMHSAHNIRISATAERTWRGYLGARPQLYALDPKGKNAHVRLVAAGFRAGSTP